MNFLSETRRYPRLIRRVQAAAIDVFILYFAFIGTALSVSHLNVPPAVKIGLVTMIIFILEPGLVSFTGATIGHRLRGLMVEHSAGSRNLGPFRAIWRFSIKIVLGLPSLIFVRITKRHQALHDLLSRSVVVLRYPEKLADREVLTEHSFEGQGYINRSIPRRLLAIFLYNILLYLLVVVGLGALQANGLFQSDECWSLQIRSQADHLYEGLFDIGWLFAIVAVGVAGWRGRLWGCRRMRIT